MIQDVNEKVLPSMLPDAALFLLRFSTAAMLIAYHGFGKISGAYANLVHGQEWGFTNFVAGLGFPFARLFAVCAALAEVGGGLLLAAGLWTRYASPFIAFTMLVAVYYHVSTGTGFELAAFYFLIALTFVFVHPGRISLDALIFNRAKRSATSAVVTDTA